MRIDLNLGAQPLAESGRSGTPSPVSGQAQSSAGGALGEDQAQLSGMHTQIQALAAQASDLPEAGQEKVNALRQMVLGNSYQPSPEQVAKALFAHMLVETAV
jgi:flagellar biosynthesis anti-sigma factor FlgM